MDRIQRSPTRVDQPSGRRETEYQPSPARSESVAAKPRVDNRKIVGVLASYTWRPEGELFAVREGRTHIGAGQINEDPEHRPVEVCCPLDDLLSGDHAMILVTQQKFYIRDLASTNGTFVNGEQLRPETTEDLPNNAEIKTGKTVFTFMMIEPKSAPHTEEPRRREEPPPRDRTVLR
jgi:pSer/pThr/pTyr-binding forkhead associated (FHA) protein